MTGTVSRQSPPWPTGVAPWHPNFLLLSGPAPTASHSGQRAAAPAAVPPETGGDGTQAPSSTLDVRTRDRSPCCLRSRTGVAVQASLWKPPPPQHCPNPLHLLPFVRVTLLRQRQPSPSSPFAILADVRQLTAGHLLSSTSSLLSSPPAPALSLSFPSSTSWRDSAGCFPYHKAPPQVTRGGLSLCPSLLGAAPRCHPGRPSSSTRRPLL